MTWYMYHRLKLDDLDIVNQNLMINIGNVFGCTGKWPVLADLYVLAEDDNNYMSDFIVIYRHVLSVILWKFSSI
jgi:hypothetical protein